MADFHKAVVHFAAKADLDPNEIRTAYRGREELLCERDDQKRQDKFVGMLAGGGLAVSGAITQITVIAEYNSSAYYSGTFSAVDNVELASPFLLMFAAVAAWKLGKAAKVNWDVKRDIKKFTAPQLPKPGNLV